ncbi:CDP-alcohol phosphatidyltransferase family protein [Hartmannibacter diazotrophicus]|uniref:CDP-alcohol phosphatidyltransferase family protein n=1 Tax=Hartmannibacter diazotrophicus TaxID=1482074 RepID=UPI000C15D107|nr:CDP-alcohol phosphatidyltransferase family protein [Hartmannibacter diazotrophicus]
MNKHQNALIALAVHAFTASGIVVAMLAAIAAYAQDWPKFFGLLGFALAIDGVDGPIARWLHVERRLPTFSGAALDFVVDYVTYVFLPAMALAAGGFGPTWISLALAGVIVFTSAMYFADTRMKMKNNAFRGFPAVWNGVIFLFFVFRPPIEVISVVTGLLAVLTFLPVAFVHPVRVVRWRPLTLLVCVVWSVCAVVALTSGLDVSFAVGAGLLLSSLYLALVSAVHQLLDLLK